MRRYWMVHIPGTQTRYQHATAESAVIEAERLSKGHSGPVVVLEAIGFRDGIDPDELPLLPLPPSDEEADEDELEDDDREDEDDESEDEDMPF